MAWLACQALLFSPAALAQQRSFQYFTQTQGLGNLVVNALAQDRQGYLWIGTENGVYRFDGGSFVGFGDKEGLLSQTVNVLHVDADDRVWAGSDTELYVSQDGRFAPVRMDGKPVPVFIGDSILSLPDGRVLAVSKGRLIAFASGGAGWSARPFFTAGQIEAHPALKEIHGAFAGRGGVLWLACRNALCRVDGGRIQVRPLPKGDQDGAFASVLEDSRGSVWVRSNYRLLQLRPGTESFVQHVVPGRADVVAAARPIAEDALGRILTFSGYGLARWDGERWEAVGSANGLQSSGVAAMLVDRHGGAWLGTSGSGLVQWLGYRHFKSWTGQDGLPHSDVWSFHRDRDGPMHIGTGAGVALVQAGRAGESLSLPRDLRPAKTQVSSLVRDGHGALWISTFTGSLLRQAARGGPATVAASGLPMVYRLLVDAQGLVWLLTERGLFVVDGARPDAKPRRVDTPGLFPGQGGPLMVFNGCADRSGQLWLTSNKGMLRIVDGVLTPLPLFEQDGRTPARHAYNLIACGADGSTWLAGGEGRGYALARWKDGRGVLTEAVPPHLADRLVMALHEDRRGWLWVATDAGVAVTDTAHWRMLRQDSGLLWNDSNQGALYEDPDGSLWIGTSRGAVHLEHPESLFDHLDLAVAVNALSYGSTTVRPKDGSVLLPWSGQSLRVSMAGLQYESRRALRFHSRLLGLSEEWTVSEGAEQVYTALPPGHYVLEMKIENGDLLARSPVQSIEIVITPPWWRSGGFYALLALASALLVYALFRWRIRKVYRRQQELERLVAERTAELAASHEQMRELAMKDGLTGVWNRRALTDILAREHARALRERSTLTLVLVDADHFKRINDEHGHLAGDAVLKELARRLVAATRLTDAVGRYGGEEFVIALPGLSPADPACVARIEAIHRSIGGQPFVIGATLQLAVTCSFGVACLGGDAPEDVEPTLARADAALYRAKERGRNRIEYADAGEGAADAWTGF